MSDTASDGTIRHVKVVRINDDEEARVDEESQLRWYALDPKPINDIAIKCSGCQMVTVHHAYTISMVNHSEAQKVDKRIVTCTNCGKISTK